ncbi:hypothetical protein NMY22_g7913 [Coprinellus aureogranulatus]|nr:hypothetical protein NMY22_g7913 [Coprinellus aureogranulatus]
MLLSLTMKEKKTPQKPPYDIGYPLEWWLGSEAELLQSQSLPRPASGTPNEPSSSLEGHGIASRQTGTSHPRSGPNRAMDPRTTPASKPPSKSSSSSSSSSTSSASTSSASLNEQRTYNSTASPYSDMAFRQHVTPQKKTGKKMAFLKRLSSTSKFETTVKPTTIDEPTLPVPAVRSTTDIVSDSDRESIQSGAPAKSRGLTKAERDMYASERLDNFRWISKLVGSYADCKVLDDEDLVPDDVKKRVDEIGLYSELVYSSVPVKVLFENHQSLKDAGVLQEYQTVLSDCDFLRQIDGAKTDLSAYVVYRRSTEQLVVSISGSSKPKHAIQNLRAIRSPWPGAPPQSPDSTAKQNEPTPVLTVHSGFLALYQDIKADLQQAIQDGICERQPKELIITGHSMGGSVSHLLCMDLLSEGSTIELPPKVCLATYGTPRTGNAGLVKHYQQLISQFKGAFDEVLGEGFQRWYPSSSHRTPSDMRTSARSPCTRFSASSTKYLMGRASRPYSASNPNRLRRTDLNRSQDAQTNTVPERRVTITNNGRDLEGFRRITDRLVDAGFPSDAEWATRFRK